MNVARSTSCWKNAGQSRFSIVQRGDAWVTAMHWKGLNEWDFFEKRLLGAMPGPPDNVAEVAELAADAFLAIYGTNGKKAGKRETPKGPLKRTAS